MTDPFRDYKKASKSSVIVRMIKFKTHTFSFLLVS